TVCWDGHPQQGRTRSTFRRARERASWLYGLSLELEISRVPSGFRVLRVHRLERFANDRGHCRIARPFAISRNHMPWCPPGGAFVEHDLVGGLVLIPKLAVPEVAWIELPTALGIIETRLETLALLLLRDVQHELEDRSPVLA